MKRPRLRRGSGSRNCRIDLIVDQTIGATGKWNATASFGWRWHSPSKPPQICLVSGSNAKMLRQGDSTLVATISEYEAASVAIVLRQQTQVVSKQPGPCGHGGASRPAHRRTPETHLRKRCPTGILRRMSRLLEAGKAAIRSRRVSFRNLLFVLLQYRPRQAM